MVSLTSVGGQTCPVFTAESAENAELILELCGLGVLRGKPNTLEGVDHGRECAERGKRREREF